MIVGGVCVIHVSISLIAEILKVRVKTKGEAAEDPERGGGQTCVVAAGLASLSI